MTTTVDLDHQHLRRVLGHHPTGVVVVTAMSPSGEPLAMTIGSFTSVSLDPPLVAFLPSKTSSSWAALKAAGDHFAINVLSDSQWELAAAVSTRKTDKLDGFAWTPSAWGHPLLDGSVAHLDCQVTDVHDGGDHDLVMARVLALSAAGSHLPLVFHQGGFHSVADLPVRRGSYGPRPTLN